MAAAGVRRVGGRFRPPEATTGGAGDSGYYFLGGDGGGGSEFARVLEEASASAPAVDAPATAGREASAMAARITPAVLFVTVVLAVVLLVSGLLHLLRRLFLKTHHGGAGGGERQLQHLFFPGGGGGEDGAGGSGGGGLAQAAIDALPEFAYAELSAAAAASSRKGKEKAARPFDCAVCLCEFAGADRLHLLPSCGHAFHVACIDVWLRSSATCPLCRTKLSPRHLAAAAADADAASAGPGADDQNQQQDQAPDEAAAVSSVVLPVRLGRFTCADGGDDAEAGTTSSGSRVDGRRRCYSMGSYQYVLADEHLLVSVHMRHGNAGGAGTAGGAAAGGDRQQQLGSKKVFARGDSFSVSKIWQWRGSKRLPASLCADDGLPWAPVAKDPAAAAATHTRQQQQRGDT
ncbi:unnamed protein product [Urochloa decumbens]|uniref:RING-type E3 ubiquitin transferase n=1 Tax=Urochloa decumbens TaxID=240449 RepID=A0ABC9FFK7_9POAL